MTSEVKRWQRRATLCRLAGSYGASGASGGIRGDREALTEGDSEGGPVFGPGPFRFPVNLRASWLEVVMAGGDVRG